MVLFLSYDLKTIVGCNYLQILPALVELLRRPYVAVGVKEHRLPTLREQSLNGGRGAWAAATVDKNLL